MRCPIIPTINDREEHLIGIAELADKLKNIIEINVEPYHTLGKSKAEKLGREYLVRGIDNADDELIKKCLNLSAVTRLFREKSVIKKRTKQFLFSVLFYIL